MAVGSDYCGHVAGAERDLALDALAVFGLLMMAGALEQSIRLRNFPPALAWASRTLALAAGIYVLSFRHEWIAGDLPFAELALLTLAGSSGLLLGLFVASLGRRPAPAEGDVESGFSSEVSRGVRQVLADANRLAVVPMEEEPHPLTRMWMT